MQPDRAALPQPGNDRRLKELEQMLRIYFLQQWFNLSDPAAQEAFSDSVVLCQFAGFDVGSEPVPEETTICNFTLRVLLATGMQWPTSACD